MFLEDNEDYYIALSRLERNSPKLSLAEMEKRFGLED